MTQDVIEAGHVGLRQRQRGQRAYLSGAAAEASVAAQYARQGVRLRDVRWRGQGGEIDLILEDAGEIVFCEVKCGPTHDAATERLRPAQVRRIMAAASEYMARLPQGQLSDVRFDLATVSGTGEVRIVEAAFGHF